MACRAVDLKSQQANPVLPIPTADLSSDVEFYASTGWSWLQNSPKASDLDHEWTTKCRKSTAVAKKATTYCAQGRAVANLNADCFSQQTPLSR